MGRPKAEVLRAQLTVRPRADLAEWARRNLPDLNERIDRMILEAQGDEAADAQLEAEKNEALALKAAAEEKLKKVEGKTAERQEVKQIKADLGRAMQGEQLDRAMEVLGKHRGNLGALEHYAKVWSDILKKNGLDYSPGKLIIMAVGERKEVG